MSINPNPAANYVPPMKWYSGQGAFRFWCQTVLPLVYDDSLSYYELLNKLVNYLNNTIYDVANVEDNVGALHTAYAQLEGYVNDYFSSLDVQEEINKKLDAMAIDGSLSSLINPFVAAAVDEWLREHLTPTSPALDDTFSLENAAAKSSQVGEIIAGYYDSNSSYNIGDYCVYEGMLYKCKVNGTTGTWDEDNWSECNVSAALLRNDNNISELNGEIDAMCNINEARWSLGYYISSTGNLTVNDSLAVSNYMPCSYGDRFVNKGVLKDNNNLSLVSYIAFYKSVTVFNDTFVARINGFTETPYVVDDPEITGYRLVFGRATNSGVTLTTDDIETYFNILHCEKTVSYNEIYKNRVAGCQDLRVWVRYAGSANLSDIKDMPDWSYFSASHTLVNSICPTLTDTLPSGTYIVKCYSYNANMGTQTRIYEITRITGGNKWVGYYNTSTQDITWKNISYDVVKSIADTAAINLNKGFTVSKNELMPDMFCYTTFDNIERFWTINGGLGTNTTLYHTQNLKIIPGGKLYMCGMANQEVIGAFFDYYGNWVAPFLKSNGAEYEYKNPAITGNFPISSYVTIMEFTAPENAFYVSLNLSTSSSIMYRTYISSKPVFLLRDTGNFCVKNDPIYSYTSKKKVCVIGASKTMIGRLYRSELQQYIVGWQEYIAPWFDLLETYGCSGYSMGTAYQNSIYNEIVTNEVDLTKYDTFIIMSTHNGLTTTGVGSWGTVDTVPSEHETYMGALRNLIEYIYTQNTNAVIYLATLEHAQVYFSNPTTYRPLIDDLNDAIKDICDGLSLRLIDLARDLEFNMNTYYDPNDASAKLTYDGTHYNQNGARDAGHVVRKAMLGI